MVFSPKTPSGSQALSAYIGKQITLAITNSHGPANKPEISLFIGNLQESGSDFSIVAHNGKMFTIPRAWLAKVKPMDGMVRSILGGSDLLLPITKPEFESAGFIYQRDRAGVLDIQVVR